MKRLLSSAVLIFCMLVNFTVYSQSSNKYLSVEEKICELKNLGIIHCYEDGEFYPEKYITRAEFCKMISVIQGGENNFDIQNDFSDVPTEHWANRYITFCFNKGLINGIIQPEKIFFVDVDENGNETERTEVEIMDGVAEVHGISISEPQKGMFAPDQFIMYQDALKILVNTLGYEEMAKPRGDYPNGYVSVAKEIGIVNNNFTNSNYLTRENAADIVYNSLFVPLVIRKDLDDENGKRTEYIIADGKNGIGLQTLYGKFFNPSK